MLSVHFAANTGFSLVNIASFTYFLQDLTAPSTTAVDCWHVFTTFLQKLQCKYEKAVETNVTIHSSHAILKITSGS